MNILYGAYYTILTNLRDWKYLVLLIAAPILTILLTGVSTDHIEKLKITEKVKIVYYSEDSGNISKGFNEFIESEQIKQSFDVQKGTSLNSCIKKVSKGQVEAFIYFSKDFSKNFLNSSKTDIMVYSSKGSTLAKPLVESYINSFNTGIVVTAMGEVPTAGNGSLNINEVPLSPTGIAPTGVDKWTYSNMLIFLFYAAILSGFSIINEVKKHTILRIDCAPISKVTNTAGKIIGNVITLFGCSIFIIIFTKYVFKSNWNGNMLINLTVFFLYCVIVICFGFILGSIIKKIGITVLAVICTNVLLFTAAGGGWGSSGNAFPKLSIISPQFYAIRALSNNIFNGLAENVYSSIIALLIIAIIMLVLSIFFGRRKVR